MEMANTEQFSHGITELNFDELDLVDGGIAPAVIAGAKIIAFVGAIAIAAAIDYFN